VSKRSSRYRGVTPFQSSNFPSIKMVLGTLAFSGGLAPLNLRTFAISW
jgi:hypothetical protein